MGITVREQVDRNNRSCAVTDASKKSRMAAWGEGEGGWGGGEGRERTGGEVREATICDASMDHNGRL